MAEIHRQIYEHYDANEWEAVGETTEGATVFKVSKDGIPKAWGTLIQLSNMSRTGVIEKQSTKIKG